MAQRVIIAGGYGVVGAAVARLLRDVSPTLEIVLAGRRPDEGAAIAAALGAQTRLLDVSFPAHLADLGPADLVVAALYDPDDALLTAAGASGAGYVGVTKLCDSLAPLMARVARAAPTRPIAPFGHWVSGVATLAVREAVADFARVDAVHATALFDVADALGPMSAGDAEHLMGRAYLRRGGQWEWLEAPAHVEEVTLFDGSTAHAIPMALLDGPAIVAFTGAAEMRFDIAQAVSRGAAQGGRASHDVHVVLKGVRADGAAVTRRLLLSDPEGIGRMTALGVAAAAVRILGLDGDAPAPGGLYAPDSLMDAARAMRWFREKGLIVETRDAP